MNSRRGRPMNIDGRIYQRPGSAFWWMRYPDHDGKIQRESTGTIDEVAARRILRDRVSARDEGRLPALLAGETLTFDQWANWYMDFVAIPVMWRRNEEGADFLSVVFGHRNISYFDLLYSRDGCSIPDFGGQKCLISYSRALRRDNATKTVHSYRSG